VSNEYTDCDRCAYNFADTEKISGNTENSKKTQVQQNCSIHQYNSFIPFACAECKDSLPFSGASSIPLCYVLFPATLLNQLFIHPLSLTASCHLFLGLPLNLLVPKFIHNTLLGILFSSILCTCPNQCNLFYLIVSIIVGFLTLA